MCSTLYTYHLECFSKHCLPEVIILQPELYLQVDELMKAHDALRVLSLCSESSESSKCAFHSVDSRVGKLVVPEFVVVFCAHTV